jgi:hypothetical protein
LAVRVADGAALVLFCFVALLRATAGGLVAATLWVSVVDEASE